MISQELLVIQKFSLDKSRNEPDDEVECADKEGKV